MNNGETLWGRRHRRCCLFSILCFACVSACTSSDEQTARMEKWFEQLRSADLATQWRAVHALSRAEDARVVPRLTEMLLTDGSPSVRVGAAWTLGFIRPKNEEAIVALVRALRDDDEQVRILAAFALDGVGEQRDDAVPALKEMLKSTRARLSAVVALGTTARKGDPTVIAALRDVLLDPAVQQDEKNLIMPLGMYGYGCTVREKTALALSKLGPDAVPALVEGLGIGKSCIGSIWALRKMGPEAEAACPSLLALVKQARIVVHVRMEAADSLAAIGCDVREAVPFLVDMLGDEHMFTYKQAFRVLRHMGQRAKEATPALQKLLKDGDVIRRAEAALTLMAVDPTMNEETVPVFTNLLAKEPMTWKVRFGLEEMGESGIPALVVILREQKNMWMRYWAARTLGEMGGVAKAAIPALLEAAEDEDETLRKAAKEALAQIRKADSEPETPATVP